MSRFGARLALLGLLAAALPACGGGGGDSPVASSPTTSYGGKVILGTPGQVTIKANGGRGTVGAGGSGGFLALHNWGASDAKIWKTGSVDSSFTTPATLPTLGANPRTIAASITLTVGSGLTAGSVNILGDDGLTSATGLRVLPGVTLTLGPNIDADNADADGNFATGTLEQAHLSFTEGMIVEGTIRSGLKDGSPNSVDLYFDAITIVIAVGGTVDSSGADVPGGTGANSGGAHFQPLGQMINRGTVVATGGAGDVGGNGGNVNMWSERYAIWNAGPITTSGGAGAAGVGGIAGGIWLEGSIRNGSAAGGGLYNSGDLTARGGHGTAGGGPGNYIYHYNNPSDGPLLSSGIMDCSGGNALTAGNGGNSGYIRMNSVGGGARVTGSLIAHGGNGAGAAGNGGNGNLAEVSANSGTPTAVNDGAYVSANFDTSGGDGAVGGNAGTAQVWDNANYLGDFATPGQSPAVLAGYLGFEANGGDGATNGGLSGAVKLYSYAVFDAGHSPHIGGLFNEVPVVVRGGAGTIGSGGGAQYIFVGSEAADIPSQAAPDYDRVIENTARLELKGGAGGTSGGNVGYIQLFDRFHVKNSGALFCLGGAGNTGVGGYGGDLTLRSDGITENTGELHADGGSSIGDWGGGSGLLAIDGKFASTHGAITARGGSGLSNNGGYGGIIDIGSWNGQTPTAISGVLNVLGGTGTPAGSNGIVTLDGIRVALVNGIATFP